MRLILSTGTDDSCRDSSAARQARVPLQLHTHGGARRWAITLQHLGVHRSSWVLKKAQQTHSSDLIHLSTRQWLGRLGRTTMGGAGICTHSMWKVYCIEGQGYAAEHLHNDQISRFLSERAARKSRGSEVFITPRITVGNFGEAARVSRHRSSRSCDRQRPHPVHVPPRKGGNLHGRLTQSFARKCPSSAAWCRT